MQELFIDTAMVLLLIFVNGFFALSEIAIVSANRAKLTVSVERGNRRAAKALELAEEPGNFLSTIQIGITLVGVLAGAYGGTTIAQELSRLFSAVAVLSPYHDALALGIVVVVITLLSVVMGELVPKQMALRHAERMAAAVAFPVYFLSLAAYPVVRFLALSSAAILRIMGIVDRERTSITEEEVKILMREGRQAGVFHDIEHDIVRRVFTIDDLSVADIMIPRPDVVWLDTTASPTLNLEKIRTHAFSYFPVAHGNLDNLLGVVDIKDLLDTYISGLTPDLARLAKKPVILPETISAMKVVEHFQRSPVHMAFIVDEYGVVQGIVTVEDILAAIVGDLPALAAPSDPEIFRREDGSWLVDGAISLEKLKEILEIDYFPDEEQGYYHTLGGLLMKLLERVPALGDRVCLGPYRLEVVDMDGNRVDKVLVSVIDEVPKKQGD
ncbi:MAG: hemolysin family protein [Syntrophales bacterium]|nr:hemolysin family protein [Syntrophales bacterium]